MALSQRLEIRQSHALVMTPQLMQAIKLLQLSNLDLAVYVENELEHNPLLDRAGEGEGEARASAGEALSDGPGPGGARPKPASPEAAADRATPDLDDAPSDQADTV